MDHATWTQAEREALAQATEATAQLTAAIADRNPQPCPRPDLAHRADAITYQLDIPGFGPVEVIASYHRPYGRKTGVELGAFARVSVDVWRAWCATHGDAKHPGAIYAEGDERSPGGMPSPALVRRSVAVLDTFPAAVARALDTARQQIARDTDTAAAHAQLEALAKLLGCGYVRGQRTEAPEFRIYLPTPSAQIARILEAAR